MESSKDILFWLAIVITACLVAIRLSREKRRTEQWWHRKSDVYSTVTEALRHLKAFYEHQRAVKSTLTEDQVNELIESSKVANNKIATAVDTDAAILSGKALKRLKQYQDEITTAEETPTRYECLARSLSATDNCLNEFIEISQKDLQK